MWTHPSAVVASLQFPCAVELLRLVTSDDIITSLLKTLSISIKFHVVKLNTLYGICFVSFEIIVYWICRQSSQAILRILFTPPAPTRRDSTRQLSRFGVGGACQAVPVHDAVIKRWNSVAPCINKLAVRQNQDCLSVAMIERSVCLSCCEFALLLTYVANVVSSPCQNSGRDTDRVDPRGRGPGGSIKIDPRPTLSHRSLFVISILWSTTNKLSMCTLQFCNMGILIARTDSKNV